MPTKKPNALPDYLLKVKEWVGAKRGVVGVAWKREDGSVSIQLNPCNVLDWRDHLTISLFPADKQRRR